MRILLLILALSGGFFTVTTSLGASADEVMEQQAHDSIPTSDIKRFVTSIAIIRHYYIKNVK